MAKVQLEGEIYNLNCPFKETICHTQFASMQTDSFVITLCTKKLFSLLRQPQVGELVQSGINRIAVVLPFEHYFYFSDKNTYSFFVLRSNCQEITYFFI